MHSYFCKRDGLIINIYRRNIANIWIFMKSLFLGLGLCVQVVLGLLNYLIQLTQLCWWQYLYHLTVKCVLLWLHLLHRCLEKLNLVHWHQWALVVVIILLLPKLRIIIAIISQIEIVLILILLIILILTILLLPLLNIYLINSLLRIFLYQLYQCLKQLREHTQNEIWLFRVLHQTRETQNNSLSLMLFLILWLVHDKFLHKNCPHFLFLKEFVSNGWMNP